MTRRQILNDRNFKFSVKELVCPHIYASFGDASLDYLDVRLLEVLMWIRKRLGKPMVINTWGSGGNLSQRGMRCNMCEIVREKDRAYLSPHVLGQGVDFTVIGMSAHDVRQWLKDNEKDLPHHIRLERKCGGKEISWVHLDIRNEQAAPIVFFDC